MQDLRKSGLSNETIAGAGFHSASVEEIKNILGFNPNDSAGLVIPYPLINGSGNQFMRVKMDVPPIIDDRAAKYLSPKGSQNRIYVPQAVISKLNDSNEVLYITEGEKKALKAIQEGLNCIALAGVWCWKGRDNNGQSLPIPDLSAIQWKGRRVYIVFDSDASTNPSITKAETALAEELVSRGALVSAIRLPSETGDKVGLDDFLLDHSVVELLQLPQHNPAEDEQTNDQEKRESQGSRLVRLASELYLFHDQNKEAYAFLDIEAVPLKSKKIKQWLTHRLYASENKTPNSDAMNQAIMELEAKAIFEGNMHHLENRIALNDQAIWYDMGNSKCVKITPDEWGISDAPVLFRRYPHQMPQVTPIKGGNPFRIFDFLNVPKDQRLLTLICIISYFIPDIPHPIFHPHGPHGAGKTSLFRAIKRLCDPSSIEALIAPKNQSELIQIISHHHVCLFDNLSNISTQMSDILSQACTGGGFSKRQLYTDDDDIIYHVKRCIGINGINLLIKKPDLMDRSILIHLERIDPSKRIEESELWNRFDIVKPEILGGIFDAISRAMVIYPTVRLSTLPRMADFAKWGYAIAEGLGHDGNLFLESYRKNINLQNDEVIQSNTLAQAVMVFMKAQEKWSGTIKEAWTQLKDIADPQKTDSTFPKSINTLRPYLERIKANLLDYGIGYTIGPRGEKGYPILFQKHQEFGSGSTFSSDSMRIEELSDEHNLNQNEKHESNNVPNAVDKLMNDNEHEHPEANEPNNYLFWNKVIGVGIG